MNSENGNEESKYIKTGSKDYEIIESHPIKVNGEKTWGAIDYAKCKIKIDNKELCKQMQFNALIHEILHGCLYEIGSELHKDEQFTEALSNMLTQVIIDNRDLYELE